MENTGRPLMVPPWLRDLLVKAAGQLSLFDESKVARHAKGPKGGQFAPKGGGKRGRGKAKSQPARDTGKTSSARKWVEGTYPPQVQQELQEAKSAWRAAQADADPHVLKIAGRLTNPSARKNWVEAEVARLTDEQLQALYDVVATEMEYYNVYQANTAQTNIHWDVDRLTPRADAMRVVQREVDRRGQLQDNAPEAPPGPEPPAEPAQEASGETDERLRGNRQQALQAIRALKKPSSAKQIREWLGGMDRGALAEALDSLVADGVIQEPEFDMYELTRGRGEQATLEEATGFGEWNAVAMDLVDAGIQVELDRLGGLQVAKDGREAVLASDGQVVTFERAGVMKTKDREHAGRAAKRYLTGEVPLKTFIGEAAAQRVRDRSTTSAPEAKPAPVVRLGRASKADLEAMSDDELQERAGQLAGLINRMSFSFGHARGIDQRKLPEKVAEQAWEEWWRLEDVVGARGIDGFDWPEIADERAVASGEKKKQAENEKGYWLEELHKGIGFADPFVTQLSARSLAPAEVVRALRLALALEEEAISVYMAMAEASDDPRASGVLRSIANEERVHVGELQAVIEAMEPGEEVAMANGRQEAEHLMSREDAPPKVSLRKSPRLLVAFGGRCRP